MRLKQFAESKTMKLCLVGGARPNFMKIAPLSEPLPEKPDKREKPDKL
jgi:UDP-N-acetylglucosamine 2-epimerase